MRNWLDGYYERCGIILPKSPVKIDSFPMFITIHNNTDMSSAYSNGVTFTDETGNILPHNQIYWIGGCGKSVSARFRIKCDWGHTSKLYAYWGKHGQGQSGVYEGYKIFAPMDEASKGKKTTYRDVSGLGNHGHGTATRVNGKFWYAQQFNGEDYIDFGDVWDGVGTVSMWMLGNGNILQHKDCQLFRNDEHLFIDHKKKQWSVVMPTGMHYLAVTFDETISCYIDGKQSGQIIAANPGMNPEKLDKKDSLIIGRGFYGIIECFRVAEKRHHEWIMAEHANEAGNHCIIEPKEQFSSIMVIPGKIQIADIPVKITGGIGTVIHL
jgi:hypothetical protein